MDENFKKYLPIALLLTIFVTLSYFFYFYTTPERLVEYVGINNAYVLVFALALIGGLTTFSGVPYHIVLITLAFGGVNPFFLGAAAATGVILGDSTSYYLGYLGGRLIPERLQGFSRAIHNFGDKHPKSLPLFFFFFSALTPFSNDFIVITMGVAHYSFWKVMIPLALGNLVFNISIAYFATSTYVLLLQVYSAILW